MKIAKIFNFNKEKAREKTIAVTAGGCSVAGAGYLATKYLETPYGNWFLEGIENFSDDELKECASKIDVALKISGLKEKGVVVHDISFSNIKDVVKELNRRIDAGLDKTLAGRIIKQIGRIVIKSTNPKPTRKTIESWEIFAKGRNATFVTYANSIVLNTKKLSFAVFHEMGHALNVNTNKFAKMLSSLRIASRFSVPVIAATALLKNKKAKGEKPIGFGDKTTTFIKDNAGKLTFACMTPVLLEEGLASIRGGRIAKKVLSKDLSKKINNLNLKAWGTYVIAAAIASAAMSFGVYVSDNMFSGKQSK